MAFIFAHIVGRSTPLGSTYMLRSRIIVRLISTLEEYYSLMYNINLKNLAFNGRKICVFLKELSRSVNPEVNINRIYIELMFAEHRGV